MADVPGIWPRLNEPDQHLIRRFTYGFNTRLEADVMRFRDGREWFESQLHPGSDPAADATAHWLPHVGDSPATAWANAQAGTYGGWQYGHDLVKYTLARRVIAVNQVHEVMVDFWSNLLHIPAGEDTSFPWRMDYDAMAIRPHALGTYRALLRAAVTHPSMSGYLSNYKNTKTKINENLGRELLELYTVGRQAGYTEDDVKNSARLLTGFTVAVGQDYAAGYNPARHHTGPVTIMDRTFANTAADGRAELNTYLDWLAHHPATAARIAKRLCVRFISDDPPQSSVDAVTATYLSSGTDIKACLRTLTQHTGFLVSAFQKARTPVEDVLATQRACDIVPTGAGDNSHLESFAWMCSWTGQEPLSWPRPDGFPEQSNTYLSPARLLRSWTAKTWMANSNDQLTKASRPKPRHLLPPVWPLPLSDLVHHQAVMMTGRRATAEVIAGAATLTEKPVSHVFKETWERKPEYMTWMLTLIRSAILNAPEAMLR